MKKIFTTCCALLLAVPTFAQKDEFGTWLEFEAETKVNKRIEMSFGLGMRANDNLGEVSRANAFISGNYKVCDFLKAGATYQYISDLSRGEVKMNDLEANGKFDGYNVDEAFHRTKHRLSFDLSSKVKVGRFTFSIRERYQYTHSIAKDIERMRYRDEVPMGFDGSVPTYNFADQNWFRAEVGEDRKHHKNDHLLRSRIGIEYDIKKCPLAPFATYEIKTQLQNGGATEETRLIVGADWKLNKKNTLSIAYVFNDSHYSDDPNVHAVSIGYKIKF